jgi:Spy/CpxP family protein refolding chaperone
MNRWTRSLAAAAAVTLSLAAFTAGDLALGRIAPAAAQAAPGGAAPGGGQAGRGRFGQMLMSLNLSPEQTSQIKSIMANARAKAKSLTDMQAKRDTMRGAFKDIEAVLTPAQKAKLQSERDAYKAQHGGDSSRS